MRTLLLMRHAKSSWKDESIPDEARPLTERGKDAARQMGIFLEQSELVPDLILCSTAKRAKQTAKRIRDAGHSDAKIVELPELYFSGPRSYLKASSRVPDNVKTLLVIGHNPDLESLIEAMVGAPVVMPTAAIARVDVRGDNWAVVCDSSRLSVHDVYRPKELSARV